ncbi:MAG: HK97 family phage prohead protease [Pseudomonadota bacterium]
MEQTTIRFAGYAALFDIPDADRDTIRRGAFAQTLERRSEPVPLLWQHRPDQRIGTVESIAEDERGLRVVATIENLTSRGAAMLKRRAANGLSFGYRTRNARHSEDGRELLGIDLFEVSLVTHPLQHGARVHLIT